MTEENESTFHFQEDWKWSGKWLKYGVITATNDQTNKEVKWETIERKTKKGDIEGVIIIPILHSKSLKEPQILLEMNYRPALEGNCIEFPAGLIDEGESVQEAGIRELFEETGYRGSVNSNTLLYSFYPNPWMCTEGLQCIIADVDLDAEENQHVQSHLEKTESISTFSCKLSDLYDTILEKAKDNYLIAYNVYSFSLFLCHSIEDLMLH